MVAVTQTLSDLRRLVDDGKVAEVCRRYDVQLLVLFGSALTSDNPGDVDLAVQFGYRQPTLYLEFMNELALLLPGDNLDFLDLGKADPVALFEVFDNGEPLHAATPDLFTDRQLFAMCYYMDTKHLRQQSLETLAHG